MMSVRECKCDIIEYLCLWKLPIGRSNACTGTFYTSPVKVTS